MMSEFINNQSEKQAVLKELITRLHDGAAFEEVKKAFAEQFEHVTATEITQLEAALIEDGMPVEEIQRLCDVHADVFKGSIEEIHAPSEATQIPGHPVGTMLKENRFIESLIDGKILLVKKAYENDPSDANRSALQTLVNQLRKIDVHYARKENLIFPLLEKHDITAPPKVMWGVDDEVRQELKAVVAGIESLPIEDEILKSLDDVLHKIKEMIFKEENILVPMMNDTITDAELFEMTKDEDEFGYMIDPPKKIWQPDLLASKEEELQESTPIKSEGLIHFDAGSMTPVEVNAVLNTLPIDATFVDAKGRVKYFTQGKERIFPRPKTIIGREVSNCHPPASVHIVEQIVEELKSGKKDHEDFWIKMGEQFVYIRYFAVRDPEGKYLGVLEVTQNIKPIVELKGEKRLVDNS